jgi:hypothetical protein
MAHFHIVDEKDVITVAAETPIDATISAAAAFTRGARPSSVPCGDYSHRK